MQSTAADRLRSVAATAASDSQLQCFAHGGAATFSCTIDSGGLGAWSTHRSDHAR
jgi:hypothetical protein